MGSRSAQMVPQKYERHVSRIGGTSGGLGRGGHTRSLWGKIAVERVFGPAACWEWRGYLDKDGYPKMTVAGPRTVRVHRWLWEQERHAIARGEVLINLCGNRACINPSHKRVGAQVEAIRNGGRGEPPDNRGELSATAKLRKDDVLFIRSQPKAYGLVPVLAKLFGVSPVTIAKIREGRSWRHMRHRRQSKLAMPLPELRALLAQRNAPGPALDDLAQARAGEVAA